jgi:hypothetical protein
MQPDFAFSFIGFCRKCRLCHIRQILGSVEKNRSDGGWCATPKSSSYFSHRLQCLNKVLLDIAFSLALCE